MKTVIMDVRVEIVAEIIVAIIGTEIIMDIIIGVENNKMQNLTNDNTGEA